MSKPTLNPAKAAQTLIAVVNETVKDFTLNGTYKGLPSSHLWLIMEEKLHMSLDTYNTIINALTKAGYIRNQGHLLVHLKDLPFSSGL